MTEAVGMHAKAATHLAQRQRVRQARRTLARDQERVRNGGPGFFTRSMTDGD